MNIIYYLLNLNFSDFDTIKLNFITVSVVLDFLYMQKKSKEIKSLQKINNNPALTQSKSG